MSEGETEAAAIATMLDDADVQDAVEAHDAALARRQMWWARLALVLLLAAFLAWRYG